MKQNIETMRYKVPKVKNRFLQTHLKLIVICAVVAAVLILLAFSYVIIHQSYILEPKTTILLFCEVDDVEAAQNQLSKHADLFKILLVRYEDEFKTSDGYDFSSLGSKAAEDYVNPSASLLAVVIPTNGLPKEFDFSDLEMPAGAIVDAQTLDSVIAAIRSSL